MTKKGTRSYSGRIGSATFPQPMNGCGGMMWGSNCRSLRLSRALPEAKCHSELRWSAGVLLVLLGPRQKFQADFCVPDLVVLL